MLGPRGLGGGALRGVGRGRVVLGQQRPEPASSGPEAGERVGLARHAGKRVGVDRGLVRRVSYWFGLGSGDSGRQLERLREVRSIHDSGRRLARHASPKCRLPLGQDRLILLGCSREMNRGDCPED